MDRRMINMEEAQAEIKRLRDLIDEAYKLLLRANNPTSAQVSPSYYNQAIVLLAPESIQG